MSEEMRELTLDELEQAAGGLKVRLLKDAPRWGKAGDVVDVSDGYARNFLIPRGLAEDPTSPSPPSMIDEEKRRLKQEEDENRIIEAAKKSRWTVDEIVEMLRRK